MKHRSTWWKTLIGVILTLVMLFPVYWMINIAFTERSSIRSGDLYPKAFTLENFQRVFADQMPYLGTSLVIALSCVLVTLLIALPASYAIAILRLGGAKTVNFLLVVAQMIPAVVMALGFYRAVGHDSRSDSGRFHSGRAVRGDVADLVHVRHARVAD